MLHVECSTSLAWFRLEEFVGRRERERAWSMYRLLAHSWNDDAYTRKLAGDLAAAFGDTDRAAIFYLDAAVLYEQSLRRAPSAFCYERYVMINKDRRCALDGYQKILQLLDVDFHLEKIICYAHDAIALCIAVFGPDSAWAWCDTVVVEARVKHYLKAMLLGCLLEQDIVAEHDRNLQELLVKDLVQAQEEEQFMPSLSNVGKRLLNPTLQRCLTRLSSVQIGIHQVVF